MQVNRSLCALPIIVLLMACGETEKVAATSNAAPPRAEASPLPAPSPAPAHATSNAALATVSGEVLETMDAGSYTYMRLKTGTGELWAAVPKTQVKTGQSVTVGSPIPMDGFESPTLHRKFDRIVFGVLGGAPPAAAAPTATQGLGMDRATVKDKIEVARAEGTDARSVAEVFAQKGELSGKSVSVRGQVVKVVRGVMGRNFLHVRDGSGTAATQDDDLTVTSQDDASVGDVVTVQGTVKVDQDFGAGYAYKVIVEDARLRK